MPEKEKDEKIKTMLSVHPISNFLKLIFLLIISAIIAGIITVSLYPSNFIINGTSTTDFLETQRNILLVSFVVIFAISYFVLRKYGKL